MYYVRSLILNEKYICMFQILSVIRNKHHFKQPTIEETRALAIRFIVGNIIQFPLSENTNI